MWLLLEKLIKKKGVPCKVEYHPRNMIAFKRPAQQMKMSSFLRVLPKALLFPPTDDTKFKARPVVILPL